MERYVLITGGSGYVGSAVACMLVEAGFKVFNLGRNTDTVSDMETVPCDLSDTQKIRTVCESILEKNGPPEALVHMASAPTTRKALEDATETEVAHEFAIAVDALKILTDNFVPSMKDGSTIIGVTTASLEKDTPEKNIGAYIPAKQKMRNLLKELHEKWEDVGIRVFAVAPSFLPGGLNKDIPEGVRKLLARKPGGYIPTADDVAQTIMLCVQGTFFPAGSSILVPEEIATPL